MAPSSTQKAAPAAKTVKGGKASSSTKATAGTKVADVATPAAEPASAGTSASTNPVDVPAPTDSQTKDATTTPALLPSQHEHWAAPVYHQSVILGAGASGLAMACVMKKRGFGDDFIILEREGGIGGTWYTNSYPGCGCDVPAPLYSLSFRQKTDWSSFLPKRDELKDYLSTVAAEYDLMDKFHLQTLVREARFDEATNLWHIYAEDLPERASQGFKPSKHHFVCKFFVSAVGGLSEPNGCNIPGAEKFKGAIFHSARWDHSVDYAGKNVVVLGNGSTATQIVPEVAKKAKSVTQFVRAQHWIASKPHNPMAIIPGWKWLIRHFAFFRNFQRAVIFLVMETHFMMTLMNPIGAMMRWWFANRWCKPLAKKAPKEYYDHILPQGKVLVSSKRRIFDDDYVPSLNLPHVKLEFERSAEIDADAIITDKGKRIPADVIVLCNGFTTARAGFPMDVYGRGGVEVHDLWNKYGGGSPIHYRSTLIAGFPNMAQLVGSNSATGHTSLLFTSECQVNFALQVAKPLLDGKRPSNAAIEHSPIQLSKSLATLDKARSFEPKLKSMVNEQYWIHWLMQYRVFHHGKSWYRDPVSGRITSMHPASQISFWLRSEFPDWRDLQYEGLPQGHSRPDTNWWRVLGHYVGLGRLPIKTAKDANLPEVSV